MMKSMGHLSFLYYVLSYSISLPAVTLVAVAYARMGDRALRSYLGFLVSITLQLLAVAVLRYQDVTFVSLNVSADAAAKHLYFLVESTLTLSFPLFCRSLMGLKRSPLKSLVPVSVFAVSAVLILSPFFMRHVPELGKLVPLWGFFVYRLLFAASTVYGIALLIRGLLSLKPASMRILSGFCLVSILFSLWEMLHCDLFPVLPGEHAIVPLSPAAYLVTNIFFLVYVVKFYPRAAAAVRETSPAIPEAYGITDREKEIIELLVRGFRNRDICAKLFISESTVKTHIKNIYRKTGATSRVTLMNLLGRRR